LIIEHQIANKESRVFLSNQLLERVYEVASEHYPKEFGGIFTGFRNEKDVTIVDFEIPSKFESSDHQFVRHTESLNEYLKGIYERSSGRMEYLGEWHSHPNGSADYSSNDLKSMLNISRDPKVKIKTPILMILSLTRRANSYKLYQIQKENIFWMNKMILQ